MCDYICNHATLDGSTLDGSTRDAGDTSAFSDLLCRPFRFRFPTLTCLLAPRWRTALWYRANIHSSTFSANSEIVPSRVFSVLKLFINASSRSFFSSFYLLNCSFYTFFSAFFLSLTYRNLKKNYWTHTIQIYEIVSLLPSYLLWTIFFLYLLSLEWMLYLPYMTQYNRVQNHLLVVIDSLKTSSCSNRLSAAFFSSLFTLVFFFLRLTSRSLPNY